MPSNRRPLFSNRRRLPSNRRRLPPNRRRFLSDPPSFVSRRVPRSCAPALHRPSLALMSFADSPAIVRVYLLLFLSFSAACSRTRAHQRPCLSTASSTPSGYPPPPPPPPGPDFTVGKTGVCKRKYRLGPFVVILFFFLVFFFPFFWYTNLTPPPSLRANRVWHREHRCTDAPRWSALASGLHWSVCNLGPPPPPKVSPRRQSPEPTALTPSHREAGTGTLGQCRQATGHTPALRTGYARKALGQARLERKWRVHTCRVAAPEGEMPMSD